jgi:hypothetical protein
MDYFTSHKHYHHNLLGYNQTGYNSADRVEYNLVGQIRIGHNFDDCYLAFDY